ncbi:MAG: hypothetical protein JWN03_5065 [Nocardia sp.]|uniref:M48 family metalloprotease n=1 Tax=Nocardia sp. TaxID=1821 RepID=UPI0026191E4E|nr:M48 family metalloprotease [Nocardia sp.]MCU1644790.1 hypothetical protein [Nocardia sp.]
MTARPDLPETPRPAAGPRLSWLHRILLRIIVLIVSLPDVVLIGVLIVRVCAPHGYLLVGLVLSVWLLPGALFAASMAAFNLAFKASPRHPDAYAIEKQDIRLATAWRRVAAAAGVRDYGYFVRAPFSDAAPEARPSGRSGGISIIVSRKAIEELPARGLEALLAHELAHCLGARPPPWGQLLEWYAVPAGLVDELPIQLARWLAGRGFRDEPWSHPATAVRMFATVVAEVGVFRVLAFLIGPVPAAVVLVVLNIRTVFIPIVQRHCEFVADRIAVDLGYGAELREYLRCYIPEVRFRWDLLARIVATHPTTGPRVRAIDERMRAQATS